MVQRPASSPKPSPSGRSPTPSIGARPWEKRRRGWPKRAKWLVAVVGVVVVVVGLGVAVKIATTKHISLALVPIPRQTINELQPIQFKIPIRSEGIPESAFRYRLVSGPAGATVDPKRGAFAWTPTEEQGPGEYEVGIEVQADLPEPRKLEGRFKIKVLEVAQSPVVKPIENRAASPGQKIDLSVQANDPDLPASALKYAVQSSPQVDASIDPQTGQFSWQVPGEAEPGMVYHFQVHVGKESAAGLRTAQRFDVLVAQSPRQAETEKMTQAKAAPKEPKEPSPTAKASAAKPKKEVAATKPGKSDESPKVGEDAPKAFVEALANLYSGKKLFLPVTYPELRKLFAGRFAEQQAAAIRKGLGTDYEAMMAWFKDHPELQQEFYLAINPAHDNIPKAFGLMRDLKQKWPDKIVQYGQLAIAVAVVWDQERPKNDGVRSQAMGANAGKAVMPDGQVGALENFQYFLDTEQYMQGRAQFLPWEFIAHMVDHTTPIKERQWAMMNYLPRRAMIGKCYSDVPYDTLMLDTDFKQGRINGKEYTLPNLRFSGGVCAHQADFASRVAKCLGVPSACVDGTSTSGGLHAWVMWVEILAASKTGVAFSLESSGRYRYDHYYVGRLADSHTGQRITDRDLELRLHAAGVNAQNKRHTALVMQAYPLLTKRLALGLADQLNYLAQSQKLCPWNEETWFAVAKLAQDPELKKKQYAKQMSAVTGGFLNYFGKFPDFTWKVFSDLIAFRDSPKQRMKDYEQLVLAYEAGQRPDLACEARLKMADDLVSQGRETDAIEGLAFSIKKFPGEGRYVPKMLDKIETIVQSKSDLNSKLLLFYQQYLPLIPKKRGDRPSEFCMDMYERAAKRFEAADQPQAAQFCRAQIALLRIPPKK